MTAEAHAQTPRGIVRRLPVSPTAPGAALRLLRSFRLPEDRIDDVLVALSELVTNSVLHARTGREGSIEIRIDLRPGTLRVEVADDGPGFDPARVPPPGSAPGGRGLLAVHRLADRWGTARDGRTRTWAEFWLDGGLSRHLSGPDLPMGADGAHAARRVALSAHVERALRARRPPDRVTVITRSRVGAALVGNSSRTVHPPRGQR